ncbi:MAG: hypothetical protein ACKV2Q_12765 [Planctomycetaceae bacterium]
MLTLTQELKTALREAHGAPVYLIDPDTSEEFELKPKSERSSSQSAEPAKRKFTEEEIRRRVEAGQRALSTMQIAPERMAVVSRILTDPEFSLEASWSEDE